MGQGRRRKKRKKEKMYPRKHERETEFINFVFISWIKEKEIRSLIRPIKILPYNVRERSQTMGNIRTTGVCYWTKREQSSGIGQFLFFSFLPGSRLFRMPHLHSDSIPKNKNRRSKRASRRCASPQTRSETLTSSLQRPDRRFPPRARLSDSRNNYPCELRTNGTSQGNSPV